MATPKKMRTAKTTPNQFELYVNELEQNVYFRENKVTPEKPDEVSSSWSSLTKKLNASGGPIKDVAGWKKTFADWKCLVRKKARAIKAAQQETGNVGAPEKPLSEIEARLIAVTGKIAIEGIAGVEEVGVETEVEELKSEQASSSTVENVNLNVPPKRKRVNTTISSAITQITEFKESERSVLQEISDNLRILVEQNERKLLLLEKKMEIKYNVKFTDEEQ